MFRNRDTEPDDIVSIGKLKINANQPKDGVSVDALLVVLAERVVERLAGAGNWNLVLVLFLPRTKKRSKARRFIRPYHVDETYSSDR